MDNGILVVSFATCFMQKKPPGATNRIPRFISSPIIVHVLFRSPSNYYGHKTADKRIEQVKKTPPPFSFTPSHIEQLYFNPFSPESLTVSKTSGWGQQKEIEYLTNNCFLSNSWKSEVNHFFFHFLRKSSALIYVCTNLPSLFTKKRSANHIN